MLTKDLLSQSYNFRSHILATAMAIIHLGFRFQPSKAFISAAEILILQTLAKTSHFRIFTQKHNKHIVLFSTGKKKTKLIHICSTFFFSLSLLRKIAETGQDF